MAGFKWTQGRRSDWSRDWQRCHFDLFVKWLKGVLSAILLGFLQDCIRFLSSGRDCVVESHTKLQMPRAALQACCRQLVGQIRRIYQLMQFFLPKIIMFLLHSTYPLNSIMALVALRVRVIFPVLYCLKPLLITAGFSEVFTQVPVVNVDSCLSYTCSPHAVRKAHKLKPRLQGPCRNLYFGIGIFF